MVARMYALTLKIKRFRRIAKIARKKEGSWESNYIFNVEGV